MGVLLAAGLPFFAVCAQNGEEELVLGSEAFLTAHPDLNNRRRGWETYEAGRHEEALTYFRRAARYADKPSQAMVAEMLWKGEGGPRDPALAYAWMDLAAERGYPGFTFIRERYWAQLDRAQRQDAMVRGEEVYAEYGDSAARPRIDAVLRRERWRTSGSRAGFVGALQVQIPGPGEQMQSIDGSRFYDPKFWDPDEYQAWHDAIWMAPREGRVDVRDVQPLNRPQAQEGD
ncbi:hypothetical protein [Luteimonas sp. R10]|uniref:hypothetical protein n=1 Tax=Luteimonas sp. R10 TaxID=3108176 RepID=UPI00308CAC81|nr:hypothetical protein U3649_01920 [Luteimonas sp. R10]